MNHLQYDMRYGHTLFDEEDVCNFHKAAYCENNRCG
jgi:hypothetical protein